jgi:thioredoxin 1
MIMSEKDSELEKINQRKLLEMMRRRLTSSHHETQAAPPELTNSTFFEFLKSNPVVVVDFWAPWCGPCRMISPILEQLSREYSGRVAFGKLNVDENQAVSQQFQIQGIPTILMFKNGKLADGVVGALPKAEIELRIKALLKNQSLPYS